MMRKTPRIGGSGWAVAFLALGAWLGLGASAWARIGETQPEIEDRLMSGRTTAKLDDFSPLVSPNGDNSGNGQGNNGQGNGGGRRYGRNQGGQGGQSSSQGFAFSIIDNLVLEAAGFQPPAPGMPPAEISEFEHHFYFKTDDGTPAETKLEQGTVSGWVLMAYFYKGVSVLEIYRRVGPQLQEGEINQLLELSHGNSTWTHAEVTAATDGQDTGSFLGYQYDRADDQIRGLKVDNDLVLFSAGLDKRLLDLVKKAEKMQTTGKGAETASASVKGF